MPAPGESRSQAKHVATERRKRAWAMRQEGHTQEEIAADLGISHQAVGKMLAKFDAWVNTHLVETRISEKMSQISQLHWQISQLTRAWERSKEPARSAIRREVNEKSTEETRAVERIGDPRFLAEARACMADIRSLLGLDIAPAIQDADLGVAQLIASLSKYADEQPNDRPPSAS